jgi:c-di-AMP phosphodiesterase-like protein
MNKESDEKEMKNRRKTASRIIKKEIEEVKKVLINFHRWSERSP